MECELCGQEMDPCGLARLVCEGCMRGLREDFADYIPRGASDEAVLHIAAGDYVAWQRQREAGGR